MSVSTSGRTWDDASSPAAIQLVRRFEVAWRDAEGGGTGRHPTPDDFLSGSSIESPGARLALLRADLALRREAGEAVDASWYREHYPDLESESLVALIYEEFCLREEDGEEPDPADYFARYPDVASQLRRVLDIHGLVGTGQTTISHAVSTPQIPFPEAGQTIAGFHLVEELGRGAFARVFRAEERQLADRPVALKVARNGSREPQTLARLQHTHIVPVHSTRTDPATGLHLLCMPYFGRVTLAQILADPKVQVARHGADLVDALDRLEPAESPEIAHGAGRAALAWRTYAQAIAWWGARMAEALDHAHERGVLHRDIKPSNVLVTGDGMPMLLDFNLAKESLIDEAERGSDTLGGTLDYMAPEHLEALADGLSDRVDARSDVYGLGVVLYEALMGERPFTTPRGARSAAELLLKAADERRVEAPWLRESHPEVPVPLEAVVRRCLAPDPKDRFASAAQLAHDLQAVADDRPLRSTKEPLTSRAVRWARRNRRSLAMALPVVVAVLIAATVTYRDYESRLSEYEGADKIISVAEANYRDGKFEDALSGFDAASKITTKSSLRDLHRKAREGWRKANEVKMARDAAIAFFKEADPLRYRLSGLVGDPAAAFADVKKLMGRFYILQNENWTKLPEVATLLSEEQRLRLVKEANELLFLWAVARGDAGDKTHVEDALAVCRKALDFAEYKGSWQALANLLLKSLGRESEVALVVLDPEQEQKEKKKGEGSEDRALAEDEAEARRTKKDQEWALACFMWGYLKQYERRSDQALYWFRRSVLVEPHDYWHQFYLGYAAHTAQLHDEARTHYEAAVALDNPSPWIHFNLGLLHRDQRNWTSAIAELDIAIKGFKGKPEERRAKFARGFVRQFMGNYQGAREDYNEVIADSSSPDASLARLNLAQIDADSGQIGTAMREYTSLLEDNPADTQARQGRALLQMRQGQAEAAEADLDELLLQTTGREDSFRAQALASRAMVRLVLGKPAEAEADALAALRIEPIPSHERLWTRTLFALGKVRELRIDRPEDIENLPIRGKGLRSGMRAAVELLGPDANGTGAAALRALQNRAILLAALGDPGAVREANRAVALSPLSAQTHLVRARVRRYRGEIQEALADTHAGLEIQPDSAKLWELKGSLNLTAGNPRQALADLNRALMLGGGEFVRPSRAKALMALGDPAGAVRDWSLVLSRDPENPVAFLGRSRANFALNRWNQGFADLEQAAVWAGDRPEIVVQVALESLRYLPLHPEQGERVKALGRRAFRAILTSFTPRSA